MPNKTRVILAMVVSLPILILLFLAHAVYQGRGSVEEEWTSKVQGLRDPAQVRGLVDSLVENRLGMVPSAVPQSMWDNEACAANVINMTNFLLGEERLEMAAAWEFSTVNASRIRTVFDRRELGDFAIEDGHVVEVNDRGFHLSRLLETVGHGAELTSDRLYVMGYHYQETRNDPLILEAGLDWNSHMMLILGRQDGTWWGYQMLKEEEYPNPDQNSAFRIDDIGGHMPDKFDVVYIWEVLDTEMPLRGDPVRLVMNAPSYRSVSYQVGEYGQGSLDYWWDTAALHLFGEGDNFPTIVSTRGLEPFVLPGQWGAFHGEILGVYNGVPIRHHAGRSTRVGHGLGYQCVEYANRYLQEGLGHRNLTRSGHADEYYYNARGKGLLQSPNGSSEPPRVDDLIIFDPEGEDSNPGHVAVVHSVNLQEGTVCVVQQNSRYWDDCLPLQQQDGGWHVGPVIPELPTVGWARRSSR